MRSGLINLGGDIAVLGPQSEGSPWAISIQDPISPDRILGEVEISEGGLATSGDYARGMWLEGRRYGHLINPKTGWPVEGLKSVSVAAPTCLLAGTVSSIAMVKGGEGASWLSSSGLKHLWVNASGEVGGNLPRR